MRVIIYSYSRTHFFVQYSSQILCKIVLIKHSDLQRTRFIDMDFRFIPSGFLEAEYLL